jgi:chemotaxis protein MotB
MRKKYPAQEDENTDRWVVSYADFITLLFAFFTVMYAISHVDAGKLQRFEGSMKSALNAANPGKGTGVIDGVRPVQQGDAVLEREISAVFKRFDTINGVHMTRNDKGLVVSLDDSVLFGTGSAAIRDEAKPMLEELASLIKKIRNHVIIEGHTDNMPSGKDARYSSNWELSAARATGVLVYLLKDEAINPERLSASGYAEYRPVASNSTPDGRARNRRVDMIFVSSGNGR